MKPRAIAFVLGAAFVAAAPAGHAQSPLEWDFIVRLDGKPIGTHRFTLSRGEAGARTLASNARFEVKLLGWTAYRYRHQVRERWVGDCLASLDASTDDDGRVTQVRGRRTDEGFAVEVSQAQAPQPAAAPQAGCVMSFAYWNTAFTSQRRLLDPGTGQLVPVQVQPLPLTPIETPRGQVSARGWRIAGLPHPIDVWYDGDEWAGLDTTVQGGRKLTYRLR